MQPSPPTPPPPRVSRFDIEEDEANDDIRPKKHKYVFEKDDDDDDDDKPKRTGKSSYEDVRLHCAGISMELLV